MKLDIITPESGIFSGEVTAVSLPGKDGIFQVLNNHAHAFFNKIGHFFNL